MKLFNHLARSGAVAAVLATAVVTVPQIAPAFETASTVRTKINIAGRQRMLSQRMAKTACLWQQNVKPEEAQAALKADFDHFARMLQALKTAMPNSTSRPRATRRCCAISRSPARSGRPTARWSARR